MGIDIQQTYSGKATPDEKEREESTPDFVDESGLRLASAKINFEVTGNRHAQLTECIDAFDRSNTRHDIRTGKVARTEGSPMKNSKRVINAIAAKNAENPIKASVTRRARSFFRAGVIIAF